MDCTHCEPVLLDLCYGELPPTHEREVRAHVHDCPTCRRTLSQLEAGQSLARHLPDETPSPELTEKILRAAEAHVRRNRGFVERVQLLVQSMARIAMTRQVAMATMSLLIVAVGLWSIPELTRRREPQALRVEQTTSGEAGPSRDLAPAPLVPPVAVAPAAPPEPEADEPAASGKARGSARSERAARERPESKLRKATAEAIAKRSERADVPRRARSASAPSARAEPAAASAQVARESGFAQPPPVASAGPARANTEGLGAGAAPAAAESESLPAEAEASAAAASGATTAPAAPAAADALRPRDDLAPGSGAQPRTLEDVFRAGVERYRAEDYAAAAQLFARMLESSAPSAQRAAALLYLGRSERALGRCDRAIRAYETLVRSYGSAPQSASALVEGVACYDQLGNAGGAARLLEHASSVPSLSTQAASMLQGRAAGGKK